MIYIPIDDCTSRSQLIDRIWYDINEAISFGQDIHPFEIESWFNKYDYIMENCKDKEQK